MKTTLGIRELAMYFGGARRGSGVNDAALWLHIAPAQTKRLPLALPRVEGKGVRQMGAWLVVLSFLTPAWHFDGVGIGAFIVAPIAAGFSLSYGVAHQSWSALLLGVMFALAWLANGAVFFQWSRKSTLAWMAVPWLFFWLLTLSGPKGGFDLEIVGFIPFYLWAIGLDVIHGSRWLDSGKVDRLLAQGLDRVALSNRRAV